MSLVRFPMRDEPSRTGALRFRWRELAAADYGRMTRTVHEVMTIMRPIEEPVGILRFEEQSGCH